MDVKNSINRNKDITIAVKFLLEKSGTRSFGTLLIEDDENRNVVIKRMSHSCLSAMVKKR